MQHNTWGKDRNDLASLAGQVITEGYSSDEDGENSAVFQLLASVGELDAGSMEEFLYGLANIFDDPDVTDRAFELTFGHIGDAYDAFKNRAGN